MEICRNAGGDAPASASEAEARRIESERMATVSLRNVKKIYPFVSGLLEEMKNQRRDQKLKVTYYKLSKILISFEPVCN